MKTIQTPVKGRGTGPGCLAMGCLTSLILIGGIVVLVLFYARRTLVNFLDTQPRVLEEVTIQPDDATAATLGWDQFLAEKVSKLELSENQLNHLITTSPSFKEFHQMVRVKLLGENKIRLLFTIPLSSFGFEDKYLNGETDLLVGLKAGKLISQIKALEMNGHRPASNLLGEINQEEVLDQFENRQQITDFTHKLKALTIDAGKITFEQDIK